MWRAVFRRMRRFVQRNVADWPHPRDEFTPAMTDTALPDLTLTTLSGQAVPLRQWAGDVLVVVNTASACGFTPQLAGLQALHTRYAARGLAVIGFPCNQFGHQEPGSAQEIGAFCDTRYGVGFPLMAKTDVNGPAAHPIYTWLKQAAPGVLGTQAIKWNFTKFLVGRDGRVLARYAPQRKPAALENAIQAALAA